MEKLRLLVPTRTMIASQDILWLETEYENAIIMKSGQAKNQDVKKVISCSYTIMP